MSEAVKFSPSPRPSALLQVTQRIVQLEDGDCAQVGLTGVHIVDAKGNVVERPLHVSPFAQKAIDRGPYSHIMQQEIFEQPAAGTGHNAGTPLRCRDQPATGARIA